MVDDRSVTLRGNVTVGDFVFSVHRGRLYAAYTIRKTPKLRGGLCRIGGKGVEVGPEDDIVAKAEGWIEATSARNVSINAYHEAAKTPEGLQWLRKDIAARKTTRR